MNQHQLNKKLALQFIDALSHWDTAKLLELSHPDFELKLPSDCGLPKHSTKEVIVPILNVFSQVAPGGIKFHIKAVTAEEDRVCVAAEGESTLYDGTPYNNQYHILFRIKDDKVVEYVEYMDAHLVVTRLLPAFKAFGFPAD
jgi:uncharacterized protein